MKSHAAAQRRYYAVNRELCLAKARAKRKAQGDIVNAQCREFRALKAGRPVRGPLVPIPGDTLDERLLFSIRLDSSGCWIWTRATNQPRGYGLISNGARGNAYVHRLAHTLWLGPIGEFDVLHHCDNPPCINPEHLFLGTARDNAADMVAKGRARGRWSRPIEVSA